MTHSFQEKLEYSLGAREKFDINILKDIIPGCINIEKTTVEVDKTGIDYIATLRKGATINIDAKTRVPGASRFWKYGEPEVALEIWSKCEAPGVKPKIGWTLNESYLTDYVLYTWDKSDTDKFYFLPFQMLRIAFRKNFTEWCNKYFKYKENNYGYESEAVFVPASVVITEINKLMTGTANKQLTV